MAKPLSVRCYQLLGILLILVPLLRLAPTPTAFAAPTPAATATGMPSGGAPGWAAGTDLTAGSELPARRTANSRTYTLGHGLLQTVYAADAVNYRDAAGAWQPIDNTLVADTATPGSAAVNRANRYQVHVPTSLGAPVTVAAAGRSVAFALQGAAGTAVLAGSVARYAGAFPGVDAAVVAANTAVAEDLTLGSAAPARFRFALQTHGVTARPGADGGVAFLDAAGQVAFAFAAPRMFDAAHRVSPAVTLTLGQSSAGPTLTLAADPAWLARPQRRYPVTIDPILTVSGGAGTDCAIDSAYPASNFCSLAYLAAGASGSEVGRTLLQFGVAPTADVTILSAQVSLYQLAAATSTPGALELHQVTRPWTGGLT